MVIIEFTAGLDRWQQKHRALRTYWEDGVIKKKEWIDEVGANYIQIRLEDLNRLAQGKEPFDKPWNETQPAEVE